MRDGVRDEGWGEGKNENFGLGPFQPTELVLENGFEK